jgi:septum formation protein
VKIETHTQRRDLAVPRLVLASGSAARLRLLHDAGLEPHVLISGASEQVDGLSTEATVCLLAERKAAAVAPGCLNSLVLGCDSLLDIDGAAFGKPASVAALRATWARSSGRTATLWSGHCLIDTRTDRRVVRADSARVRFATPSDKEIDAYLATGEPMQAAGGFTIEGFGSPFVLSIDGHPSTVMGLSMPMLRDLLAEFGVAITDLWRSNRDLA